jgi:glutaredoxin-like protein DUF836
MSVPPLPDLVLYARRGCEQCEEARLIVEGLLEDRAATGRPLARLREIDIDEDATLHDTWFDRVPVVELLGRRLELVTSAAKLRRFLAEALDGPTSPAAIASERLA